MNKADTGKRLLTDKDSDFRLVLVNDTDNTPKLFLCEPYTADGVTKLNTVIELSLSNVFEQIADFAHNVVHGKQPIGLIE